MDSRLEMIQHEEIIGNLSREWELMFFKAMRPRLYIDGDKWCCLYGESIQVGVCGFGSTPYDAIVSFNKAMHTQIKPMPTPLAMRMHGRAGLGTKQKDNQMKQYKVTLQDYAFGSSPYVSYIQVSSDAELAEYKMGWGMADVQILSIEELQPGDKGWKNDN